MRHLRSVSLLAGVALLSTYFMVSAYTRARAGAVEQLYEQERLLAEQAAKGITEFIHYQQQVLELLRRDDDVIGATPRGNRLLREAVAAGGDDLLSIARVGADGHIVYTYPEEKAIGRSILDQAHVKVLFDTHRPVVSEVFLSVQGFEAVALHVPVFDGEGRFAGSLAALIAFDAISSRYLEQIRIGDGGHARLLSREGIELYCPLPGHIRKSIRQNAKDFPELQQVVDRMLSGEHGVGVYRFPDEQGRRELTTRRIYFVPIPLENTFWSVSVSASEATALSFIKGFRNRWIAGMALLVVAFGVWGTLLVRTMLALHREEARQAVQDRLLAAERERERLGEQLRQAQKLEAIGQLAGGVAHDYNNLLTVQLGHLGLLKQGPALPPDVQESLGEIEKSANMAAQLTRQLLAFSRRQVLQIRRVDLNESVEALTKMLRRVLREDIALELRLDAQPLWIDADAGMIEQVIMNLVVNARDAMPEGGRLTLSTSATAFAPGSLPHHDAHAGAHVCLTVADTGTGMDAETRRHIFEPFFTTKPAGEGTGLGLPTAYGIVKQHRGWIEVESRKGRGSVFRVYVPAAAGEPADVSMPVAPERDRFRGRGETVLVAEDNPSVRNALTRSLQRLNYTVLPTANSLEATQTWAEHRDRVDLLLTDMVMVEGGNGLDLARSLRADRPDLPVILMSGYSQDLVTGGLAPDMVFLPKPWTSEVLARTVRQSLDARGVPPPDPASLPA